VKRIEPTKKVIAVGLGADEARIAGERAYEETGGAESERERHPALAYLALGFSAQPA